MLNGILGLEPQVFVQLGDTSINLMLVKENISHWSENGTEACVEMMDLQKVYDRIHWETMLKTLETTRISLRIADLVKIICAWSSAVAVTSDEK